MFYQKDVLRNVQKFTDKTFAPDTVSANSWIDYKMPLAPSKTAVCS